MLAGRADHQEIARIDRHAEMLDAAADRLQRRRNDVAAVGNRRGAEDDRELGAAGEHLLERARQRGALVRHAAFGNDGGTGRRQPFVGDLQRLLDHLGREPREHGGNDTDLADAVGRDAHPRPRRRRQRKIASGLRDRERNDLTVAIISPGTTGL